MTHDSRRLPSSWEVLATAAVRWAIWLWLAAVVLMTLDHVRRDWRELTARVTALEAAQAKGPQ